MNPMPDQKRIIAIDIRSRSFGFAVFEGSDRLLHWGAKRFDAGVNPVKVPPSTKLLALFDEFTPSVVVTTRPRAAKNARRLPLLATIQRVAKCRKIRVIVASRGAIQGAFLQAERNDQ
jgi:hypothetical protein